MNISSAKALQEWLKGNDWFQDSRVLELNPRPESSLNPMPSEVTIDIASYAGGDHNENSKRMWRVFRLRATGIDEYRLEAGGTISEEHWSEGVEILDSQSPISLRFDLPGALTLRCAQITVEERPQFVETVKPWLSDWEVSARISSGSVPTPKEWLGLFKRHNQSPSWRTYGSESRPAHNVPEKDYEGWFLQAPDGQQERQGIFFFSCKPQAQGFSVHLQNQGASRVLWRAAMNILGEFKDVEIKCGNRKFSGTDWLAELKRRDAQQADEADRL